MKHIPSQILSETVADLSARAPVCLVPGSTITISGCPSHVLWFVICCSVDLLCSPQNTHRTRMSRVASKQNLNLPPSQFPAEHAQVVQYFLSANLSWSHRETKKFPPRKHSDLQLWHRFAFQGNVSVPPPREICCFAWAQRW